MLVQKLTAFLSRSQPGSLVATSSARWRRRSSQGSPSWPAAGSTGSTRFTPEQPSNSSTARRRFAMLGDPRPPARRLGGEETAGQSIADWIAPRPQTCSVALIAIEPPCRAADTMQLYTPPTPADQALGAVWPLGPSDLSGISGPSAHRDHHTCIPRRSRVKRTGSPGDSESRSFGLATGKALVAPPAGGHS
jgi:hypothetical protein